MRSVFMAVKKWFCMGLLALTGALGVVSLTIAQDSTSDPYQQIEQVTVELLETIAPINLVTLRAKKPILIV